MHDTLKFLEQYFQEGLETLEVIKTSRNKDELVYVHLMPILEKIARIKNELEER